MSTWVAWWNNKWLKDNKHENIFQEYFQMRIIYEMEDFKPKPKLKNSACEVNK